jgi:endonuclease III
VASGDPSVDIPVGLARQVDALLEAQQGPATPRPVQDPLDELIQTILSQNTADVNSDRAYAGLIARFGRDWEAVRAARVAEVADSIRGGGLADTKARRIQLVLSQILERLGELDLTFLREAPLEDGRQFLRSLDGVGPKTAACVLLFACGKPAMPVDTHVFRVSQRLGLIGAKVTPEQAHIEIERQVEEQRMYPFHMHLIRHGREVCHAQRPRCADCVLVDICAYARG